MSLIDQKAIENILELQSKTGKNLLKDLIDLYVESTPDIVSQMISLSFQKNYLELSNLAHSLKSSSANLGVQSVMEAARDIEYKISVEEKYTDEEITALVNKIESEYPKAFTELQSLVRDNS